MPNNSTVAIAGDGYDSAGPGRVEQVPDAIAEVASDPPTWLLAALAVVVLGVVALAVLGWRRHGALDEEVRREMAFNGALVVTVVATTGVFVDSGLMYWGVVAGGWIGGVTLAYGGRELLRRAAAEGENTRTKETR